MLNLDLECRLVKQRMADLQGKADRARLLREARSRRAEQRPIAEVVRIPHAPDLRRERA